jgi:hypothetical protein
VRGGMDGDGHELSILIRLGDGERQGRGPSSVSTMIIRPPPWVAAAGEADLRLNAVVGAPPSGRLMGLRLRPALLLPARRLGVRRPFNEAGLTCRDAVERSALIV